MTSLVRNSALSTFITVCRGKTPTFSRQQLTVKDLEITAEDGLETPLPRGEKLETDDKEITPEPQLRIVTWNGKGGQKPNF